jgi:superfamily II DNA or RNA helicase
MADYNWQSKAVVRFTRARISAIIAACGTGKTRVGIKLALDKLLPVVVIVPKNITRQWKDEILEIAGKDQKVWIYDAPTEHKNPAKYADEFLEWLKPMPGEIAAMERAKMEQAKGNT